MDSAAEDFSDSAQLTDSDSNQQGVYFVPYRWWKEAHDSISAGSNEKKGVMYEGSPASSYGGPMKLINNIFNSDIAFNLRRDEDAAVQDGENGEVGVSGRDFALVSGEMWVQALKWHSEAKISLKESRSFSAAEDDMSDVYPLQLRLGVVRETSTLAVRITKKDNSTELFKRACKIFSSDTEMLRIWDFSGQTTLFFLGDNNRPLNCPRQPDQEVLLELQIYGLSDSTKCREGKKDEKGLQNYNGSFLMNGSTCNGKSQSIFIFKSCGEAGSLGLAGLHNLGNTCFMNSSLQCLAHTPRLVDYFLGDYTQEINHGNPLGMDGEIALAFGDLLRKLWEPGATAVAPRTFKTKLARFAPQFSGYNQHDSQELLAFLLDGLHEDLNRVKCKPYVEAKDTEERPDAEVADEYWHYHLARNNSIIVDVCQGQYKSTLVCPVCKKVSFTFDPFMYLSLPLPSTRTRTMTLTVVSSITNGSAKPSPYTITVPMNGKFEDLIQALSAACALGSDETLLVAEVYNSRIIRFLEDPSDSLKLIRDEDQLVAYRLTKPCDQGPLVVFMHRKPEQYLPGSLASYNKTSEIPLVARLSSSSANGSDICSLYHGLLSPFRKPIGDALVEDSSTVRNLVEDTNREDGPCPLLDAEVNYPDMKIDNPQIESCTRRAFVEVANGEVDSCPLVDSDVNSSDTKTVGSQLESELQFYLTDEKGFLRDTLIKMDEPILSAGTYARLNVLVCWSEEQIKKYDDCLFSLSPEMVRSGFLARKPQETVSLYKCLEAFLTEEPLGPEDMWYCPRCKEHRQASKKLDLWRLPEILVIHLKRFSYDRFLKNKLETYVDFPVDDLDLSSYIASGNSQPSDRYMLYAISNHYGSMGGGHYTAFVHHGGGRWYDFDDNRVSPISPDKIKTSAAYVLFYRRVSED